ncbi:protein of unassigned function [Methylobacterium oryzae CBMB20]|uniref:Protein of unassigned function n=1 Tax=Methylobacterium oryzae CBMB20 TaxID=693986 RepID=A0A089NVY8_9HYPH|nr:protein of unassigned function [Methylobacterium oryzae CBMB20]
MHVGPGMRRAEKPVLQRRVLALGRRFGLPGTRRDAPCLPCGRGSG